MPDASMATWPAGLRTTSKMAEGGAGIGRVTSIRSIRNTMSGTTSTPRFAAGAESFAQPAPVRRPVRRLLRRPPHGGDVRTILRQRERSALLEPHRLVPSFVHRV